MREIMKFDGDFRREEAAGLVAPNTTLTASPRRTTGSRRRDGQAATQPDTSTETNQCALRNARPHIFDATRAKGCTTGRGRADRAAASSASCSGRPSLRLFVVRSAWSRGRQSRSRSAWRAGRWSCRRGGSPGGRFQPVTQPSKGRPTGSVNGYDSHLDPILLVRQSTAMPSKETG